MWHEKMTPHETSGASSFINHGGGGLSVLRMYSTFYSVLLQSLRVSEPSYNTVTIIFTTKRAVSKISRTHECMNDLYLRLWLLIVKLAAKRKWVNLHTQLKICQWNHQRQHVSACYNLPPKACSAWSSTRTRGEMHAMWSSIYRTFTDTHDQTQINSKH